MDIMDHTHIPHIINTIIAIIAMDTPQDIIIPMDIPEALMDIAGYPHLEVIAHLHEAIHRRAHHDHLIAHPDLIARLHARHRRARLGAIAAHLEALQAILHIDNNESK
jgi:CTP synthase (UTP-ammonia lyase)